MGKARRVTTKTHTARARGRRGLGGRLVTAAGGGWSAHVSGRVAARATESGRRLQRARAGAFKFQNLATYGPPFAATIPLWGPTFPIFIKLLKCALWTVPTPVHHSPSTRVSVKSKGPRHPAGGAAAVFRPPSNFFVRAACAQCQAGPRGDGCGMTRGSSPAGGTMDVPAGISSVGSRRRRRRWLVASRAADTPCALGAVVATVDPPVDPRASVCPAGRARGGAPYRRWAVRQLDLC